MERTKTFCLAVINTTQSPIFKEDILVLFTVSKSMTF